MKKLLIASLFLATLISLSLSLQAADKKIVFIAGNPSHGFGSHEHKAGCMLLAKSLHDSGLSGFKTEVVSGGWPKDESVLDDAACIVMYCDGGGGHFANKHLPAIDKLAGQGVGIVCIHYGVEVPAGDSGDRFLNWIGGYFEAHWSVNPHWTAEFEKFADHPSTRGVKPFSINDEWYYHMRFRPEMKNVTPILTDLPPKETLKRGDGAHSGNPSVRKAVLEEKQPQHVAWAAEREDTGRGFGFTGGHFHWNWGNNDFRKLVCNAILWSAKVEVPESGVPMKDLTVDDLLANQDEKTPGNFNRQQMEDQLAKWNGTKKSAKASSNASVQFVVYTQKPALVLAGTGAAAQGDVHDPENAVANLDVHEDLEATLFASEPMLTNPSNIDIDHRGRVWVCEIVNYRRFNGKRPEGDRILIIEDTDSDGIGDKETLFYQAKDFISPHGICVLPTVSGKGTKAIVSFGDKVVVMTDTDGDDKADQQDILFTGISGTQHDHGIHAFVFGPDGKLYFNFGNSGHQLKDKDGKPVVDKAGNEVNNRRQPYQEGMVFRCDMDGSNVETLGWNFRNNWEVTVDSYGRIWQSDNDDDGNRGVRINFVMEFGNYGYKDELTGAAWNSKRTNLETEIPLRHWHLNDPGVMPNLLQTGAGSPTGLTIYEGDLLPQVFQGEIIHTDAGPSICRAYPVETSGAGYTAEVVDILDGKRNKWFRPDDVSVAPDGSLIVSDWYDPGVGGHNAGDLERGRLFRVTPTGGGEKYSIPKFDFTSAKGCVEALKNPNYTVRYMAWTALHTMGDKAAGELQTLAKDANPIYRVRALWLLGKIDDNGQQTVTQAMADADPEVRAMGLRLGRQLLATGKKVDQAELLKMAAADESPIVRRECAVAIADLNPENAADLWTQLALEHDDDRWYLEALGIAGRGRWDACMEAWLKEVGGAEGAIKTPAGRDIVWRSRAKQTPALLAAIIQDKDAAEEEKPRYFRAFDFLKGPEKDEALKSLLGL